MNEDPNKKSNPEAPATDTPTDDSELSPELLSIIEEISSIPSDSTPSTAATDVHEQVAKAPITSTQTPELATPAPESTTDATPTEPAAPTSETKTEVETEPTPVQEPTPLPQPTPSTVSAEPTPTKKSKTKHTKTPLIIGLLLLVVLVALGIFWFIYRNTPKIQALEAASNLFSAKNLTVRGDINIDLSESPNSGLKSFKINFSGTSSHIPETSAVSFILTDLEDTVHKIDLSETVVSDGTIYFKTSGLKKALSESDLSELTEAIAENYSNAINIIDDQWWMVSIPDIISHLNQKYSANLDESFADSYQCAIDFIAKNDSQDLVSLYQKHQFANIEAYTDDAIKATDGGNLFTVNIDATSLGDYYKAIQDSDYKNRLAACFSSESDSNNDNDDLNIELSDYEFPQIYAEISNWDHRLLRIYVPEISADESGFGFADLHFEYPANTSIDAPSDAKPATILLDAILENSANQDYNINIPNINSDNSDTSNTYNDDDYVVEDVYVEEDEELEEGDEVEQFYGDDDNA